MQIDRFPEKSGEYEELIDFFPSSAKYYQNFIGEHYFIRKHSEYIGFFHPESSKLRNGPDGWACVNFDVKGKILNIVKIVRGQTLTYGVQINGIGDPDDCKNFISIEDEMKETREKKKFVLEELVQKQKVWEWKTIFNLVMFKIEMMPLGYLPNFPLFQGIHFTGGENLLGELNIS